MSPSPSYSHSFTDRQLSFVLLQHINEQDLGELVGDVDTVFDDLNVRRPDIIFIVKSRLHLRDKRHGIHFPPDLCVEILSPGSATMDQSDKFDLYAQHGVANYWMVDPLNQTFNAFKLESNRYVKSASGVKDDVVTAPPFPTLQIPLSRIWSKAS